MNTVPTKPRVFVSYAHEDADLKKRFDTNLRVMERQGVIEKWTDGEIQPGDRWAEAITEAMNCSQIILFMVSNNFLDSDFIRNTEAPLAIQRMMKGEAVVIPILLRNTPGWKDEKWCSLQALPSDVKPVEDRSWHSVDAAFADVEARLREMIKLLPAKLEAQKIIIQDAQKAPVDASDSAQIESKSDSRPAYEYAVSEILVMPPTPEKKPERASRTGTKTLIATLAVLAVLGAGLLYYFFTKRPTPIEPEVLVSDALLLHDKDKPFENSLGMKFVRLPGTEVLCSIWELRVRDYEEFADSVNYSVQNEMYTHELDPADQKTKWGNYGRDWRNPGFYQDSDLHPVVGVSLVNAKRFCEWLTEREQTSGLIPKDWEYRIIRDEEWSIAVGDSLYPWNPYTTQQNERGNYQNMALAMDPKHEYEDNFSMTAPVGSFPPNNLGIYDLGGNVAETVDTVYESSLNSPYIVEMFSDSLKRTRSQGLVCSRGLGWTGWLVPGSGLDLALSESRGCSTAVDGDSIRGFRVVLSPVDYSLEAEDKSAAVQMIEHSELPKPFILRGTEDGDSFSFRLPMDGQLKDFEATIQYRILKVTEETGVGIALGFRKGALATHGYRVFMNHQKTPVWGLGYFDLNDQWEQIPWVKIDSGQMAVDGSPNRLTVIVKDNLLRIYSNGRFLGEREFDGAPLAGDLTLFGTLNPFWYEYQDWKGPLPSAEQFVEVAVESIEIKPL